jgi:hypothetical protein
MAHFPFRNNSIFRFGPTVFPSQLLRDLGSVENPASTHLPLDHPLPPSSFQLSRITAYFRTFLTTLWTAPASALLFVQKTYQLYRKRYYCIAPPLTISLNEEKLRAAFRRLQVHPEYTLMRPIILTKELLKRGSEDEKVFNYLREYLSKDITLGETLELLHRVRPQQSCRELLASVDHEQVLYYQMLHKMEQAFNNHKSRLRTGQRIGRALLTDANETGERQLVQSRQKTLQQHSLLIEQLEKADQELKTELYPRLSEIYKLGEPAAFAALEKIVSDDTKVFSGRILIVETDESIFGKNKLVPVRSIFIQQRPGQYRFYNSINAAEGFYVHSNKESFLIALRQQLLALGPDTQIQFSI